MNTPSTPFEPTTGAQLQAEVHQELADANAEARALIPDFDQLSEDDRFKAVYARVTARAEAQMTAIDDAWLEAKRVIRNIRRRRPAVSTRAS